MPLDNRWRFFSIFSFIFLFFFKNLSDLCCTVQGAVLYLLGNVYHPAQHVLFGSFLGTRKCDCF